MTTTEDHRAAPEQAKPDPSSAVSVKLQKWLMFSLLLASLGVGTDALAAALSASQVTASMVLGRGELYMVSIGMLFSAVGELLYDRTRLRTSGAWQVSLAFFSLIVAAVYAIVYGFVKAGRSATDIVAYYSILAMAAAFVWGFFVVLISGLGGRRNDQ